MGISENECFYRNSLLAEKTAIERMIDETPESCVIDRMSLEYRKMKVKADLRKHDDKISKKSCIEYEFFCANMCTQEIEHIEEEIKRKTHYLEQRKKQLDFHHEKIRRLISELPDFENP